MARQGFPSDKQDQFVVRLPDGLRDRIKAAAEASGRSMNAEIVKALEDAFPAWDHPKRQETMKLEYILQELKQLIAKNGGTA
jgi:plasmid stability protein